MTNSTPTTDAIYALTRAANVDLPDAVAKVGLYLRETTAEGLDYTPDELDDLTGRKVEEVPFSGDALALIISARRGTARATGQADPYPLMREDRAASAVWGPDAMPRPYIGNTGRRMAAVGGTGGHGLIEATHDASRYGTGYGVERYEF